MMARILVEHAGRWRDGVRQAASPPGGGQLVLLQLIVHQPEQPEEGASVVKLLNGTQIASWAMPFGSFGSITRGRNCNCSRRRCALYP